MSSIAGEDRQAAPLFTLRNFSLALALLLAAWFWPVLVGGESFIYRDFGYFGYPLAHYHREAFWRGEIPLWNPYNHCGLPFLAQWNTMVLYPGTLIYLLLPLEFSLSFFDLAHLWGAGVGMFVLARSWYRHGFAAAMAGFGFAISGLALNFVLWPNNVAALAWMPLLIWSGLDGRSLPRTVAIGAMQMLTGAPEMILLTWGILLALVIVRSATEKRTDLILGFIGAGILVAVICAAQLLPFLDLVRISQRHGNFGGAVWAMPLWGWGSFFVPQLFTYDLSGGVRFQYEQLWTSSYYPSIVITTLALLGLMAPGKKSAREKVLYLLALFGVLLAFGPAGQIHTILKSVVPGFGFIRFPIKFVILTAFALPLLAAGAIARLDAVSGKKRLVVWLGLAAVVGAIATYAKFYPKYDPPFDNWALTLRSGVVALVIASLALFLAGSGRRKEALFVLLALIPLDIALQIGNPAPSVDRSALTLKQEPIQGRAMLTRHAWETLYLKNASSDTYTNFVLNRLALNANLNLLDRIPKVDGFFSLNMAETERLRNQLYAKGQENLEPLMDFMGVTRVSAPGKIFDWQDRTNAMPLVTAGQAPRVLPDEDFLPACFSIRFNPRTMVLMTAKAAGYETNAVEASVSNLKAESGRIEFDVNASKPTFAVVSESFHPNWRVTVNGEDQEKIRANFAFMAAPILKGNSHVTLRYVDRAFRVGMIVSLIGVLGALGLSMTREKR